MTIEQFKKLKVGDKVMIDGKENEVVELHKCDDEIIGFNTKKEWRKNKNYIGSLTTEKTILGGMKLITTTFNFSTLKDNTFCIYDVKEGQADKIKVIMEELGIKVKEEDESIYYFRSSHIGNNSYLAYEKIVFGYLASHKETYRKTATEFLEEYGEWKGESKLKFKVGDKVEWLETGFVGTIKRHCKTFDSWYINDEYNSCSENNLELIEDKELYYKQYIGKKYAVHCKTQEEWDRVLTALDDSGLKFLNGRATDKHYLEMFGTDGNINILYIDDKISYGRKEYIDGDCTILSVEEFFGHNKEPHYKQYIGKKYAVHCKTQEEAERINPYIEQVNDVAFQWKNCESNNFVIATDKCMFGLIDEQIWEKQNYTILSVEEFFGEEEKDAPFLTRLNNIEPIINKPNIIKKTMENLKNGVLKLSDKVKKTLKRLSPEYRDLYRARYIDDSGETEKYDNKLTEILREKHREEIAKIAVEEIKEAEKEAKAKK